MCLRNVFCLQVILTNAYNIFFIIINGNRE
jgi:hypothetical protein